jgi:hypothetical protein
MEGGIGVFTAEPPGKPTGQCPRGAWALSNQTVSVGFPGRPAKGHEHP